MKVAVLLVNYNKWELTRRCLESITASRGVEIVPVLVDNDSRGGVPDWVTDMPGLLFEKLDTNTGFAGGNNRAFELSLSSGAPYTLFLNNDTEITPDTIRLLAELLENLPGVGIVTPPIFHMSDPERVWSAGGRFIPWRMMFDQQVYSLRESLPLDPVETDFASGCALMIRTELFRELGMFREDYFMYFEDSELCLRVLRNGYRIVLHPEGAVYHHVGAAGGGILSPLSVYFSQRNRLVFSRMLPGRFRHVFLVMFLLGISAVKTVVYPLSARGYLVQWLWRGWIDGTTGLTNSRSFRELVNDAGRDMT